MKHLWPHRPTICQNANCANLHLISRAEKTERSRCVLVRRPRRIRQEISPRSSPHHLHRRCVQSLVEWILSDARGREGLTTLFPLRHIVHFPFFEPRTVYSLTWSYRANTLGSVSGRAPEICSRASVLYRVFTRFLFSPTLLRLRRCGSPRKDPNGLREIRIRLP